MATTMQFGPEWMRAKAAPKPPNPPSPPPLNPPPASASYSALVSPAPPPQVEKHDDSHPFRYSKEEMLRIYREGGGKGGVGLEVERWEGVVRESASEPVGLRDMSENEKKLFAGPLNSEVRRRQSSDYLSPLNASGGGGERPRLNNNPSGGVSPMRERFGGLIGRKRDGTDQPGLAIPRKLSLTSASGPLLSPREPGLMSPRTRSGTQGSFDGVLNGGDSWIARRRISEGLGKPLAGVTQKADGSSEPHQEGSRRDIKEEDDDNRSNPPQQATGAVPWQASSFSNGDDGHRSVNGSQSEPQAPAQNATQAPVQPSDDPLQLQGLTNPASSLPLAPPPGLPDPAGVEWSYLDPQGQVQGPFKADIMQKWHDEGYFTPDLLMKRTHMDTEFVPVSQLKVRAMGEKIFLTQPTLPAAPPGLGARTDSPFAAVPEYGPYPVPHQPIPTRTARNMPLDSFLASGSNPSDSPASSYGAGRLVNRSPDPAAFGGRVGGSMLHGESSRVIGFNNAVDSTSALTAGRRATYAEAGLESTLGGRAGSYHNLAPGRSGSIDSYGLSNSFGSSQNPWPASIGQSSSHFDGFAAARSPVEPPSNFPLGYSSASDTGFASIGGPGHASGLTDMRGPQDSTAFDSGNASADFGAIGDVSGQQDPQRRASNERGDNAIGSGLPNSYTNGLTNSSLGETIQNQPYTPSPSLAFAQHQQPSALGNIITQHAGPSPQSSHQVPSTISSAVSPSGTSQSPWHMEGAAIRRPGPFDAQHPTARNIIVQPPAAPDQRQSPWASAPAPTSLPARVGTASPWGTQQEAKQQDVPVSNQLTFSNVGEHNQQQAQAEATRESVSPPEDPTPALPAPAVAPIPEPKPQTETPPATIPTPAQPSKKSRRAAAQAAAAAPAPKSTAPAISDSSSPPLPSGKAPWSTEEDGKRHKPSGVALGLREIQDAESKKAEARKAAEQRERSARAAATTSAAEDDPPFVASWGLPTSQAGSRPVGGAPTAGTAGAAPVWTTAAKAAPTKKTMKEIQEEEEKRKRNTVKETTAAAAARRAYAETTTKSSSAVPTAGLAWTTVGPSGKAGTTAAPNRPAISTSTSAASIVGSPSSTRVPNGPSAARAAPSPAVKAAPSAARAEEYPVTPSAEFVKWLSESLKGLNSSASLEDITTMLLSFPLDPDPSTVEIISDLIYANSTTLDGRRFANDFVKKRKEDATSRAKGGAAAGNGTAKPVSIADVARMQPKSNQPEWGGFKVVNKKKKGGRA